MNGLSNIAGYSSMFKATLLERHLLTVEIPSAKTVNDTVITN